MSVVSASAVIAAAVCFVAGGLAGGVFVRLYAPRAERQPAAGMELHAVFNVLNRLVMTTPHEDEQDALDMLSQYLRAHHRFSRPVAPSNLSAVEDAVGCYWRLTRWLITSDTLGSSAGLEWTWEDHAVESAGASPELAQAIEQGLRGLEGVAVASLRIVVRIRRTRRHGAEAWATLRAGLDARSPSRGTAALGAGWEACADGCREALVHVPLYPAS